MNEQDRETFYRTWSAAWEQCGKAMTPLALKMAYECLRDFSIEEIQTGVMKHAKDIDAGQFPPKPADIIRQIQGRPEDRALIAWALVQRGIYGEFSGSNWVVFDDPLIHRIVNDMGGFSRMGMRHVDEIPFMQKDFVNRYVAFSRMGYEPGPEKLHTDHNYFPERPPLLIGDKAKCQAILEGSRAMVAA